MLSRTTSSASQWLEAVPPCPVMLQLALNTCGRKGTQPRVLFTVYKTAIWFLWCNCMSLFQRSAQAQSYMPCVICSAASPSFLSALHSTKHDSGTGPVGLWTSPPGVPAAQTTQYTWDSPWAGLWATVPGGQWPVSDVSVPSCLHKQLVLVNDQLKS